MTRSLDFYNRLGFELKNKWEPGGTIEWCWLELDKVALMLQEYRQAPQNIRHGVGVSICFMCKDALLVYHHALKQNLPAEEPFVGNNAWVVSLADPDGYRLIFESATEVPEETVYSDWVKGQSNKS